MATHKSAAKRARQSIRKTAVNSRSLNAVRTLEKKLRAAIQAKDKKTATELYKSYVSESMRASTKGVLHASTASRKASRLALMMK